MSELPTPSQMLDLTGRVVIVTGFGAGVGRVGDACVFLCSDLSRWVTGVNVIVDCGV